MWRRIKKWLASRSSKSVPTIAGPDGVAHAAWFEASAEYDFNALKTAAHKGLLYIAILRRQPDLIISVLTVWRDERAYKAHEPLFRKQTCLQTCLVSQHLYIETIKPHVKWWKLWKHPTPHGIFTTILAIAVLLQNVKTILDAPGWLFGPPQIELTLQPKQIDVLIGDPFTFEVTARNTRELGDCSIEFFGQILSTPERGLEFDPHKNQTNPAVGPDGTAVFAVSGKALHEGTYRVAITGRAEAGVILSELPFTSPEVELEVWPPLRFVAGRVDPHEARCKASFELRPGRRYSSGIEVEAKIERAPGVRFLAVQFPGTTRFTSSENWDIPGEEVATLKWRTEEIEPMHIHQFSLWFKCEGGKTRQEWEDIIDSIQWTPDEAD